MGLYSITDIKAIFTSGNPFDVYTVEGRKVRHQVNTLEGLPKGVYVIAGKKVVL
ncbi:hypothetical protein L6475_12595 [Prevotella sp. E9-3]|uniref:hypothetical protein n=1 Tax=Prevotella sp. E9-3 TaxID=2913621 RepID=UPI001EDA53A7|nr:hypothetical protein [Prevotella sp. E9-3]UKK48031.1 hypothetical protein L6475_12595 [Prevotella sp. E9-3]